MTTFYRGPCVRITHRVLETRCPVPGTFPLHELDGVRVVELAVDALLAAAARAASTGVAGAAAVAAALGWMEGWQVFDRPGVGLTVVALLVVSVVVSGACWRARRIELALMAVYQGRPVILFQTTDMRVFEQVRRALTRALNQLEEI